MARWIAVLQVVVVHLADQQRNRFGGQVFAVAAQMLAKENKKSGCNQRFK
jgi:hypothetical protein